MIKEELLFLLVTFSAAFLAAVFYYDGNSGIVGAAFGAGVTVLAAIWASLLEEQRKERAAEKERQNRVLASRSVLVMQASSLDDFCRTSIEILNRVYVVINESKKSESPIKSDKDIPEPREIKVLDDSVFARIEFLIQHEKPETQRFLAHFLHWLQISNARIRSLIEDFQDTKSERPYRIFTTHGVLLVIATVVKLFMLITVIFDYARDRGGKGYFLNEEPLTDVSKILNDDGTYRKDSISQALLILKLYDNLIQEDCEYLLERLSRETYEKKFS
jgi:hypothetical protein